MRSSYISPPYQDYRQPYTGNGDIGESENIAVARVERLVRPKINFAVNGDPLSDHRWVLNTAVRINYRADPGVCGTDLVSPILNGPSNAHPQMLERRRRLAKPAVIRYDYDQFRAAFHELPDQRRENALIANRG